MKKFGKPIIWAVISVLFMIVVAVTGYKIGYKSTEAWLDILEK